MLLSAGAFAQDAVDYAALAESSARQHAALLRAVRTIGFAPDSESRARASAELEAAAARGSGHAFEQLAYAHLTGRHGYAVDLDRSQRYFESAVRQESEYALLQYGLLLFDGHRFPRDRERGEELILRAAQLGDLVARVFLIESLTRVGDDASLEAAAAWRNLAGSRLGAGGYEVDEERRDDELAYGYVMLSRHYTDGVYVAPDAEMAAELLSRVPAEQLPNAFADVAAEFGFTGSLEADHNYARRLFESRIADAGPWAVNNYAWLLATSPVADVRDGALAVALMEEVLASHEREFAWVDTLAAAYAEAGDFARAVEVQDEALSMLDPGSIAHRFADLRRQRYAEGRAWRE